MLSTGKDLPPSGGRALAGGFTLLELLIVLALIAVLTASLLAFARPGSESGRLRLVMSDLESDLRLGRSLAIEVQKPVALHLDPTGHFWELSGRKRRPFPGNIAIWMTAPLDGGATSDVQFFPDGSSSGAIIRFAQGSARARLTVDWLSGRAAGDRGG